MITLQVASESPEYSNKIGKFSITMNQLIKTLCTKYDQVELNKQAAKAKALMPAMGMEDQSEPSYILDSNEVNEDDLNSSISGSLKTVSTSSLKKVKKFIVSNLLSLSMHISLLIFIRELSRKMS